MKIVKRLIKAKFEEFLLPANTQREESVVIPTVRSSPYSRAGSHAYYFMNFKTSRGFCVTIRHLDIISPGLNRLPQAHYKNRPYFARFLMAFDKFHYGFNSLEQIMMMTVPHSVTDIGNGQFVVCLWAYYGYLIVDCKEKSVHYCLLDDDSDGYVFGSAQCLDRQAGCRYLMTYSLKDSLQKVVDVSTKVHCRVLRHEEATSVTQEVWAGHYSDYMHDILLSPDRRFIVVCDVGRFLDKEDRLIPSKAMIIDTKENKNWMGTCVTNGAHAQFDPDDNSILYFSNHNFLFVHTKLWDLLRKGSYTVKFTGTASVHKYRLTPSGPEPIGVFTEPDLYRLTNAHVFKHRGLKLLAAMGAPNFIFIACPDDMRLLRKIELSNQNPSIPCYIGTFSPSLDGEKLYVQTTRSFQIVDIATGSADLIFDYTNNHLCSNHMITADSTDWNE